MAIILSDLEQSVMVALLADEAGPQTALEVARSLGLSERQVRPVFAELTRARILSDASQSRDSHGRGRHQLTVKGIGIAARARLEVHTARA